MLLRLSRKHIEAADTVTFVFETKEPVAWKAGQYGIYRLEHQSPDDRKDRRFFTVAAPPFEGTPQITTRITEKSSSFKKALNALPIGGEIELIKTGGDFVMTDPITNHLMIAGGIGITPYHSIIRQLDHEARPINITLLYANRTDDFVFKEVLDNIAGRHANFTIKYIVEPRRIDNQAIENAAAGLSDPNYWISGPEPMVKAIDKCLAELGITKEKIQTDFFPGYNWPEY